MHTLRILLSPLCKTLSLKLDLETIVYDICRNLYDRISSHVSQPIEEFGLFVPDADPSRAYWMDNSKSVCYYPLADKNLVLEFKSRIRRLIVRTMDDTKKTLAVDDSKTVAELILPICNKMGISNHEEYSLILELDEEERMKTLTIRRGKNQVRDFEKLEKMKQKLKTDDELNWLPHAKTLRQLGIEEKDELLLRRKYFFSDQNVDARDPVQLSLLYVQLQNAIIDGTHPVSLEESVQLAGIQCQAELGNFSPEKQKTIHSNLKEYLPKEYLKTKGVDKKIIQQYEKLSGKSDKDAKVLYAQLCRSLKTYGITFFLVKEKVRAKNKLVPRLLGISKEKVMRVDEKTKEIIHSWPLTTVRRYAATASLFSLDFGDYSDENYVIQTTEGEKIAQLIAGYIDIIIKKQKASDQLINDVDEETAMIEENVAPSRANVISHNLVERNQRDINQSNIANTTQVSNRNNGMCRMSFGQVGSPQPIKVRHENKVAYGRVNAPTQKFQIRDLSQPKRAFMIRIGENLKILKAATEDLEKYIEVTKLGDDESTRIYRQQTLDVAKSKISSNLMSMSMATGNLLEMTQHEDDSDDSADYSKLDTAITTIGYNTDQLLTNVHNIYEMMYDDEDKEGDCRLLLNAAKQLLNAFQDLLIASKPIKTEDDINLANELGEDDGHKFSGKSLLEAVNKVGEASRSLLQLIAVEQNQTSNSEWEARDTLLTDAKQVANSVSGMVKIAKEASIALKDTVGLESQADLIHAAKYLGQVTSMLISSAKVVACSIEQPLAQQQLLAAAKQVILSVEEVMNHVQPLLITHESLYQLIDQSTNLVYESVEKLKQHLAGSSIIAHQDPLIAKLLSASERLPAAAGNSSEMVTQAHILAQAGSELAECLNIAAYSREGQNLSSSSVSLDSDRQRRLMIAAQALTDAVGKLVHATKVCSKESEQSIENQQSLMQAAHHMTSVAHLTAGEIIRQRVSKGLEFAGRQTAMTADQLILSSQEAAKMTRDSNYQICIDAQEMTDVVLPEVILVCSKIRENPIDAKAQNDLLSACQKLIKSLEQLLTSSEALGPRVQDVSLQSALNVSMQHSQTSLSDLKQCVQQAEIVLKPTKVANIANLEDGQLQTLQSWMDTAAESVARGVLYPLPGESVESVSAIIGNSSRNISKNLDGMYETLSSMNIDFSDNDNSNNLQSDLVKKAKELMDSMEKLLRGTRGIAALKSKSGSEDTVYDKQIDIINSGKQVVRSGEDVIHGVKLASVGALSLEELKQSIDKMKDDIDVIVHHIPSYQEIESLVQKLKSSMMTFENNCGSSKAQSTPAQNKSHSQLQSEFTAAVAIFNQTLTELMNTNFNHVALTSLTKQLNDSHVCMLDSGAELIKESPGKEDELKGGLKSVSDNTSNLLDQLKDVFAASGSPDVNLVKQSLLRAASLVSESMNGLLSACAGTLPPSQQQCDRSQRQLEALKTGLLAEPPSMALNNLSYAQCMQAVEEHYQGIIKQIRRIPISCKAGDSNDFCLTIQDLASSTIEMLKATTQANFQLGVIQSDQSLESLSHKSPLVEAMFDQSKCIKDNCANIISEETTELECRELANDVRKRVSSACQLVKECISCSKDHDHQSLLLEAGKKLAEATANLLKTINSSPRSTSKSVENLPCDDWTLATEHVCGSVDNLLRVVMKSNMENQRVTEQGRQAQTSIYQASVEVAEGSFTLIRAAGALVKDSKSIPANQAFIINQKTFDNALSRLNNIIKYSAPGQREFMEIEEEVRHLLRNLDRINMDNVSQNKSMAGASRPGDCLNNDIQRMQSSLKHLRNKIPAIENVIINVDKLEYMGRATEQAANYLAPITESTINLANTLPHSRDRGEILELTKTVLEAFLVAVQECQNMSSNNNIKNIHEQVSCLKEGCDDLSRFVDGIANSHGTLEIMIVSMQSSMAKLSSVSSESAGDIALAHTNIVKSAKAITETLNDILEKKSNHNRLQKKESTKKLKSLDENEIMGHKNQTDLHSPVKRLVNEYDSLVMSAISLSSSKTNDDKLVKSVLSIGQSCMDLIRYEQPEYATQVRSRLTDLLFALQSSAKGTQCCIAAANEVSQMVAELDTAIMFASSGTLNLASSNSEEIQMKLGSVSEMKEEIFKITRSLVSDLQQMIYSVDGKQENLAMAIDNAVKRAKWLCKAVKSSALVLGTKPCVIGLLESSEECYSAQTLLLNAARDVAVALVDFFNCTKTNVSATDDKEGERARLKSSLQNMVTSVDGLIKSVKSLEESGLRGTRALEAALEAMRKEFRIIEMWDNELSDVSKIPEAEERKSHILSATDMITASSSTIYTAENLVLMTKPLLIASQKALTAIQTFKQEDILIAANFGRKAVQDFSLYMRATVAIRLQQEKEKPSHIFKDIAVLSSNPDRRSTESVKDTSTKVIEHGKGAVKAIIDMYENLNKGIAEGNKDGPCKMQMKLASRRVAHSIHEVNEAVVQLKGTSLVEANDSANMAEEELLEAASQIEAAAKKLALLKPRKSDKKEKNEEDTFDGQIINACGSIVSATGHLVRMATECQQELVTQGRLKPNGDITDQTETQWSHGLISAARLVSAATENLCDSAKAVVQGKSGTERLISASKQVAAGTAHLLLACQVKSDADSQSNQRLQAAGAAVKRATEALVKEASEDRDDVDGSLPQSYGTTNKSMVTSMRNVIQAQADIVATERELERLRNKYQTIRQEQINTHPELYTEERQDN